MGEINTCSMQGGVVLGVFGILSLVVFRWSFVIPFFFDIVWCDDDCDPHFGDILDPSLS